MKITKPNLRKLIQEELSALSEKAMIPMGEILEKEEIIKRYLSQMFDELGRDELPDRFSEQNLLEPIIQRYLSGRRSVRKPMFNKLSGRMQNK